MTWFCSLKTSVCNDLSLLYVSFFLYLFFYYSFFYFSFLQLACHSFAFCTLSVCSNLLPQCSLSLHWSHITPWPNWNRTERKWKVLFNGEKHSIMVILQSLCLSEPNPSITSRPTKMSASATLDSKYLQMSTQSQCKDESMRVNTTGPTV